MNSIPATLPPEVLKTASKWFVQLTSGTATDADRARWKAWCNQNPVHEYAWQQIETVSRKFSATEIPVAISLATLDRPAASTRRRALQQLLVIFALGGSSWAGYRNAPWRDESIHYQTAVGEQRKFSLADGSQLTLNTNSSVEILFTENERRVLLHSGEILIETATEISSTYRPLVVQTMHGEVIALGTRFAVLSKKQEAHVNLFEGIVEIRPALAAANVLRLNAGQSAIFNAQSISEFIPISRDLPGWISGMLFADNMPLVKFIAELARYRPGHLTCEPSLADLRISGAFPLVDTDRVLDAIATVLPVEIKSFTRYWVTIKRK